MPAMFERPHGIGVLVLACAVTVCSAGCSSETPSADQVRLFGGDYVDPSQSPVALRLNLSGDGGFELLRYEGDELYGTYRDTLIGRGEWESRGDQVILVTDSSRVILAADAIVVSFAGRTDTLDGLSWANSDVSTPMDAVRFVKRSE
jgi:hypothetical protein